MDTFKSNERFQVHRWKSKIPLTQQALVQGRISSTAPGSVSSATLKPTCADRVRWI